MADELSKGTEQAYRLIARAAELRGVGWRTLALAFYEPTAEWLEALLSGVIVEDLAQATGWLDSDRERFASALNVLRGFATEHQGRDPQDLLLDLKVEYARLFIGALGPMEAPPYESVYRDRDAWGAPIVRGPSTQAVEAAYRRHGLQPASSHRDLPDYVATELEFMYFLSSREREAWEKGDAEMAKELRRAQQEFLDGHLDRWLPEFCGRVQKATRSNLYWALGGILREYLAVEKGTGYAHSVLREVFQEGEK